MALIRCPRCDGKVSDKAQACPHCGYGLADRLAAAPGVGAGEPGERLPVVEPGGVHTHEGWPNEPGGQPIGEVGSAVDPSIPPAPTPQVRTLMGWTATSAAITAVMFSVLALMRVLWMLRISALWPIQRTLIDIQVRIPGLLYILLPATVASLWFYLRRDAGQPAINQSGGGLVVAGFVVSLPIWVIEGLHVSDLWILWTGIHSSSLNLLLLIATGTTIALSSAVVLTIRRELRLPQPSPW